MLGYGLGVSWVWSRMIGFPRDHAGNAPSKTGVYATTASHTIGISRFR